MNEKRIEYKHDGFHPEEAKIVKLKSNEGYALKIVFSDPTDYERFLMFGLEAFLGTGHITSVKLT